MSPASRRPSAFASTGGAAVLSSVSVAVDAVEVLVRSGAELTGRPSGSVPRAVALLSTEPASTSAWVIV